MSVPATVRTVLAVQCLALVLLGAGMIVYGMRAPVSQDGLEAVGYDFDIGVGLLLLPICYAVVRGLVNNRLAAAAVLLAVGAVVSWPLTYNALYDHQRVDPGIRSFAAMIVMLALDLAAVAWTQRHSWDWSAAGGR